MKKLLSEIAAVLLFVGGVGQAGKGSYIETKAWVAQQLLNLAWSRSIEQGQGVRPWPWADVAAVGRLSVPKLGLSRVILDGAHGEALAFGPGHMQGTALPGGRGASILAGHRDTHFGFLRELVRGDELDVQDLGGRVHRYVVAETRVIDELDGLPLDDATLTLVTCYPFDALSSGGPLRYLVVGVAADAGLTRSDSVPND